ncbi:MAG TPA: AsmA family protein, partial [Dongiaceae bacterium]
MRVLAFASQKAGAGKTTLAGHVAVQAQESGVGNVAVIDVDPEAHLADWCAKRADQPLRHVHATQAELLQKIEALQNEGFDLAVIDTPPALSHSIESVLRAADLVAIPTRPYGHDLEAANATAELARQAGKPFVFIVNGAQTDAELPADLVMTLAQFGPVATTPIPRSLSFVDAMIEGRTVADGDSEQAASHSVIELWKYLAKRLPRGVKAGTSVKPAKDTGGAEPALFTRKTPSRRSAAASSSEDLPSPASAEVAIEDDGEALDVDSPVAPRTENAPRARRMQRAEPEAVDASMPPLQPVRRRSRWRWVKIAMAAGVALLLLAGVAAIIAVNNIDPRSYAGAITAAVEEATGRKLEINGDIDIAFGLTPEVVIEDITLANPKWSKQPLMASVKRLEVDIRLLPLLFGEVKIRRIVLSGAVINLERTADGKDNWTFELAGAAPATPAGAEAEGGLPEINQVRIEDSKLVFDDQAAKERREAEIKMLKLSSSGLDRTLEFDLTAILDGQPLKAAGEIDSLQALMDGGDLAVDVTLHSGESSLAAEGSIEAPYFESDMDLRIEGSGPTLAEIGRPFGVALAERGPFKLSGAFTGGNKQYRVDELDASIAQSD